MACIRVLLAFAVAALAIGCPHRSPFWSPDGARVLLLGGADGEAMDKPASRLWLVPCRDGELDAMRARRIEAPAKSRWLAVAWLTSDSFLAFTAGWEDGEVTDGSEAIWRVTSGGKRARVDAPAPSSELTMRRPPVVLRDGGGTPIGVAYTTADEKTVVIGLGGGPDGAVKLELDQAQTVGVGPAGGFLAYLPNDETGDLELVAHGGDLKRRWARSFSGYARDFAAALGKKRGEIVFNDTSTSRLAGGTIAVNFVFTDVSWNDGVQGFHATLSASTGELLGVAGATGLPGVPGSTRGWAWSVQPTTKRNVKTGSVRSVALAKAGSGTAGARGADLVIPGAAKGALHGYALDPSGTRLFVVVNGPSTRVLSYRIESGKIAGEANSVTLP